MDVAGIAEAPNCTPVNENCVTFPSTRWTFYDNTIICINALRNSFLLNTKNWQKKIDALGFMPEDIFKPEHALMKLLVEKHHIIIDKGLLIRVVRLLLR